MSRISRFAASWLALIQLYGNPHYDIVCFALSRFLIYFVRCALQPFLSFLNDFTSVTFFPCRVCFCLRRRLLSIIYPFLFLLLFLVCFVFAHFIVFFGLLLILFVAFCFVCPLFSFGLVFFFSESFFVFVLLFLVAPFYLIFLFLFSSFCFRWKRRILLSKVSVCIYYFLS